MDLSNKKTCQTRQFLGHHFEFQVAMDFHTKTSQKSLPPKTLTCPSSHPKNVELQWVINIKQATHGSHLDKNILPPVAITRHVAQSEVAMCNWSRYNVYMYAES